MKFLTGSWSREVNNNTLLIIGSWFWYRGLIASLDSAPCVCVCLTRLLPLPLSAEPAVGLWEWRRVHVVPRAPLPALQFSGVWGSAVHDASELHRVSDHERAQEWVHTHTHNTSSIRHTDWLWMRGGTWGGTLRKKSRRETVDETVERWGER